MRSLQADRFTQTLRDADRSFFAQLSFSATFPDASNRDTRDPVVRDGLRKDYMASIEGRGPRQVIKALGYSAQGLRAAFRFESSFRLEVYLFVILAPLALYLGADAIERILMFGSLLLVLTVELLNGAVEAIVDKTTPEYHELAGRSKDMGSAAVFLCMVNVVVTWSLILLPRYLGGS